MSLRLQDLSKRTARAVLSAGVGDKGLFSRHLDFGALFVCLFESRYIFDQIL